MQIGHIGLFCNPKILLNSFMFWDFEASSPFLYCPVSSHPVKEHPVSLYL